MILTTGVTSPNGNTPLVARQEIRTLFKDTDLMNIFLLGLQRFQSTDQNDPHSWFQIAGIHGRPYIAYDGVGESGIFGGYCTHSSILFPPWHRPYLALFEQTLSQHIKDIANSYTNPADRQKYTAAAERFRLPYWDWAQDADLPDFVSQQATVTVNGPQGSKTIPNPLYSYKFNPMYSNFGDGLPDEKVWESWASTLRWPTATNAAGKSNAVAMERNLANNRLTVRDRTYNLLTQATTYEAFSNDGFLGSTADPTYFDSLESIHGQMHGMTGKNGHMGVVDYAAFDPVFWLHHCNCDRVFAIWQALNPQQYVVPKKNSAGTFTTRPGTVETADSPLAPFRKNANELWTAAGVRDTRTFNYTYPELAKWSTLNPQQKSTRLRTDVNAMYGKTAAFATIRPELFVVSAPSQPVASMSATMPSGKSVPAAAAPVAAAKKEGVAPPATLPSAPSSSTAVGTAPVARETPQQQQPGQPAVGLGQKVLAATPASVASATGTAASKAVEIVALSTTAATSASQNLATQLPPSVSHAVAASGSAVAGAAQKVAAATPAPVAAAVSNAGARVAGAAASAASAIPPIHPVIHDQLPTSIAAAVPRQGSHSANPSVEIVDDHSQAAHAGKNQYTEWLANITVEKYAAKKTFFVYIFLGDFTTDSTKWGEDPNLVGTHVVFANNLQFTGCERCRDMEEQHKLVTGTIPLTGALGDRLGKAKMTGLNPHDIVPYLKKELHWRIMDQDDKVIERTEMPSLKVSVAHVAVDVPDNIANFPTWGASSKEAGVTAGRPGGANEED